MKKNKRYILIDKKPIEEPDLNKWKEWYTYSNRVIKSTDIPITDENRFIFKVTDSNCVINVKTIFLGIDHALLDDSPVLFETKITGGQYDQRQQWSKTWQEAEIEHDFNVKALLEGGFVCVKK
ncbi:MAG: hypothetical protein OQL19_00785 [Gammaproteobacteria bacterium]|nr:hypothetical protein [Gammaproteobacteria bacterium]